MRGFVVFLFVAIVGSPAIAGGWGSPDAGYCRHVESADYIISLHTKDEIRSEVEQRYNHALDVSMSHHAAYSTTPLFTWANEAKISCAKAIGYLKRWKLERPEVNVYTIQQCECFYRRMLAYNR